MDGRRRDLFKLGGILAAVGLARQARADNSDGGPTVSGSWQVQIVYDNTPNNLGSQGTRKTAMCQFFDDGRWVGSVSGVNPGSFESWPSDWRQATYHGEWKPHARQETIQAGRRPDDLGSLVAAATSQVTIQASRMRTDALGNFVANATTTIQATLSPDGQSWSGSFLTVSHAGTAVGTFTGTLSAQRI